MLDLHGFGNALAVGAWVTIKLMLASLVLGLILGLLGAGAKLSRFKTLRVVVDAITTMGRGLPELLTVLFIYFGAIVIVNNLAARLGYEGYIDIRPFGAGVVALGFSFGCYATDVFRASVLAVPKGQIEAANAFGMHRILTFRRILLPQVWRFALPGLGNLFLVLQKDTALVSVIGLNELMKNTSAAVGYTKKPFTFYLVAAFIYLTIAIVTTLAIQMLERRASRGVRRA